MTARDRATDAEAAHAGIALDALAESDDFPWMIVATVAINVLALALPILMLQVFDRILPNRSVDTMVLLLIGTLVAVAAEAVLRMMRASVIAWSAARFEHGAMCDAFSRILARPLGQTDSVGDVDRFKAIVALREHYSGQHVLQLLDLPFTLVYLALLAVIGGWMVVIPVAGIAAFALVGWRFGRHHGDLYRDRSRADRRRSNFLVETLAGIHTVKAMAMEAFMMRRYERLQEGCANLTRRLTAALDIASGIGGLFAPLMTVLVVAAGGYLVVRGGMTNGELAACILLVLRSLGPLQRAGGLWISHERLRALHEEIAPLFRNPTLAERPAGRPEDEPRGLLELRDVHFRIPSTGENLIDGISLTVSPGECIVIDGANGSGRSTLMRLAAGLLAPDSGEVVLDGQALTTLDPAYVRSAIAYVPEDAHLFQGTILDNISGFDQGRVDYALSVARALGLDKFVSRLPRGWDSPAGESAADTIPVGYRQRIAMVRALSGKASVVLFDSANVSIDREGDLALRAFLSAEKGRTTLIIVTHRPSLRRLADRVLQLEGGRISGGTPVPQADLQTAPGPSVVPIAYDDAVPAASLDAPPDSSAPDEWGRLRRAIALAFTQPCDLAACLPELLRALAWRGGTRDVAEALPYRDDTLDISGMLNCMAQLGFRSGNAALALQDLDARLLPCIFLPAGKPALVLRSRDQTSFEAFDGATGQECRLPAAGMHGKAYFFSRAEERELPQGGWVQRVLLRMRPLAGQAMVAALIYGLVQLPVPLFVMAVYGYVMPTGSTLNLAYFTAGAVAAIAIGAIFVAHRARILSFVAGRIDYLFGTAVFRQILALPASMSETAPIGAQIARLNSFESVRDLFTGPMASTLLELPALVAFIVALGIVNPTALVAVAATTLVYGALYLVLVPTIDRDVANAATLSTRRYEFLVETISKQQAVRDFGGEHTWLERFRATSAAATMAGFRVGQLSAMLASVGYFVTMVGSLAVVVLSILHAAQGIFGIGVVIASMMLMWRILGPVQTAFVSLTRLDRVRNAAMQMDRLMVLRTERQGAPGVISARHFTGRVEFERVSFRYSLDTDPALVGASFTLEPGKLVVVTGPNGGGKSTLLKLLAGLYQPQAGSVRVDETDLRQIDPVELRRAIGYVPQQCSLFRGTIAQNLRFVRPSASDEELVRSLALAGALNDVMLLPEGMGTRVGDGLTERLSVSLRQKLSLARAYLTQAPVLLFDEPASTLDRDGDRWFANALHKLKGRATILLVTHRPSHIRLADVAIVLQGGYVRMVGKPADALERLGLAVAGART